LKHNTTTGSTILHSFKENGIAEWFKFSQQQQHLISSNFPDMYMYNQQ